LIQTFRCCKRPAFKKYSTSRFPDSQ